MRWLYQITSDIDDVIDGFAFEDGVVCEGCGRVLDSWWPKPLYVELLDSYNRRMSCGVLSNSPKVKVLLNTLVDSLRPWLRDCVISPCLDSNDKPTSLSAVYLRSRLPTRCTSVSLIENGEPVRQWGTYCHVCATWRAYRWAVNAPGYVIDRDLDDSLIFQDTDGNLFLDESIIDKIDWSAYADVRLVPLPVLSYPLDELRLRHDPDWSQITPPVPSKPDLMFRMWGFSESMDEAEGDVTPGYFASAEGWLGSTAARKCLTPSGKWRASTYPKPVGAVLRMWGEIDPLEYGLIEGTDLPVMLKPAAEILKRHAPSALVCPVQWRAPDGTVFDAPMHSMLVLPKRVSLKKRKGSPVLFGDDLGDSDVAQDKSGHIYVSESVRAEIQAIPNAERIYFEPVAVV